LAIYDRLTPVAGGVSLKRKQSPGVLAHSHRVGFFLFAMVFKRAKLAVGGLRKAT